MFLAIKPDPFAGFRIQFKTHGGDVVSVDGRLEVPGEHLERADRIHGSQVIRARLMGAERAAGRGYRRRLRLAGVTGRLIFGLLGEPGSSALCVGHGGCSLNWLKPTGITPR